MNKASSIRTAEKIIFNFTQLDDFSEYFQLARHGKNSTILENQTMKHEYKHE